MKKTLLAVTAAVVAAGLIYSCSKSEERAPIQIHLTDKPAAYDEVNVHIKAIRVKIDKDTTSWISINSKDTMINLLKLRNGVTTVLATGDIPTGVLKEVRFILGEGSNVVVNGVTYPLETPSSEDAGLKIKIDKKLGVTLNNFTLDFDAALSVKEESNGYKLRPVIKLK